MFKDKLYLVKLKIVPLLFQIFKFSKNIPFSYILVHLKIEWLAFGS